MTNSNRLTCAALGCNAKLYSNNTTGFCRKHRHYDQRRREQIKKSSLKSYHKGKTQHEQHDEDESPP